eukprot:m.94034 g.94034  ORF g.94034 m.94034 type:complete len:972 (-) comp13015_c1_seq1:437-3352(-)
MASYNLFAPNASASLTEPLAHIYFNPNIALSHNDTIASSISAVLALLESYGTLKEARTSTSPLHFLLPTLVALVVLIAVLTAVVVCGRRQLGASLFEKTARAERTAEVARHEADIKASFLANMSHEIRTPLHAILSMSQMLMESRKRDPTADPQDLDDITQIIKSSETLQALVNDILFISKMQTSSFALSNQPFDVCELLEDITQLLALRYNSKEDVECVSIVRVPEFEYMMIADQLRLRQVLTNLSTNAMKFTDVGYVSLSVSLVSLHEDDDYASPRGRSIQHLLFRVIDTGEGMNQETMTNLFQRFYQGTKTITKAVGGAGLGLAISAELVSLMGGTIGVWSEGEDAGSEFWFTVPCEYQEPGLAENDLTMSIDSNYEVESGTQLARVAYEPSRDFIQSSINPLLPDDVAEERVRFLVDQYVLVIVSKPGVKRVLDTYLRRWDVRFSCGDTYEAAMEDMERYNTELEKDRIKVSPTIILMDLGSTSPSQRFHTMDSRFIFLCTDSHRRNINRTGEFDGLNYTLVNKPLKRLDLWRALCNTNPDSFTSPDRDALDRIESAFASAHGDKSGKPEPSPSWRQRSDISRDFVLPARDAQASYQILLAEDNPTNILIAQRFLHSMGLPKCDEAHDGSEAFTKFKEKQYDLVLMDCQMPNCDGFQATQLIREYEAKFTPSTPSVPIIAMTAFSLPEDQEACLQNGMDDYLSKPFSCDKLKEVVFKWLPAVPAEAGRLTPRGNTPPKSATRPIVLGPPPIRTQHEQQPQQQQQQQPPKSAKLPAMSMPSPLNMVFAPPPPPASFPAGLIDFSIPASSKTNGSNGSKSATVVLSVDSETADDDASADLALSLAATPKAVISKMQHQQQQQQVVHQSKMFARAIQAQQRDQPRLDTIPGPAYSQVFFPQSPTEESSFAFAHDSEHGSESETFGESQHRRRSSLIDTDTVPSSATRKQFKRTSVTLSDTVVDMEAETHV